MYSNGYGIDVLYSSHGLPLTEWADGIIRIIENKEYIIRLYNQHPLRAVAKIYIDNINVSDDGYIVPADSFVDIERFANQPQKFKVVSELSRLAKLSNKGSTKDGSNGVIKVEFYPEKLYSNPIPYIPPCIPTPSTPEYPGPISPWKPYRRPPYISDVWCSIQDNINKNAFYNVVTVPGNQSNQEFVYSDINIDDKATILKIKLVSIKCHTNTKNKRYCTECGKRLKLTDNFCSVCGVKILAGV